MARFSKERLENTMKLQGIKSYKELGELMGYGENIDIKRFICDEIPLNVLSNLCNTLKVSRDYLMMESDNDNLKEIHIVPDPEPIVRTGGGRPYRYISDPINYECNDIDIDRLNKLIEESGWSVANLNEFIDDNIYKILSNNANSILKATMINLSWALGRDRYYLTGESDKLNSKYISHQRICKDQSHFINRYFMGTLDDSSICMIADITNIPADILRSAKTNKVFVNDKIMHKLTNAILRINNSIDENVIFIDIYTKNNIEPKSTPQEILNKKDIEETKLDALSIIKIIDNLDTEDISQIGRYCMAEAERRNILESLENK